MNIRAIKAGLLISVLFVANLSAIADDEVTIDWPDNNYKYIDSLKQELFTKPLTERQLLDLYVRITEISHGIENDSAIVYATKGIPLAIKLKDNELLGKLYIEMGVCCCFSGYFDTAFDCFNKVNELGVKMGSEKFQVASLSMKAFAYSKQGKYNTSIDYYLKALKIYERMEHTDNCISTLANLSEINRRLGNAEMALPYLIQAEEYCKTIKTENIGRYYWRAPQVYNEFGYVYLSRGDYDEALRYAMKADSVNTDNGTINRCGTKNLLATIYMQLNDYDRALQNAKESYQHADILKDVNLYVNSLQILSDIYLAQNRYHEAETEALKAWQIDSTNIDESRDIAKNIALANTYIGNIEKAAHFLKKYSEMNKQYSEKSFHTTVSDLSFQYDTEKKQVRIASLEKDRQLHLWLGTAGVLLLVVLAGLLWITIRNARKEKQRVAEKAVREGEMNERERMATDLHDRLSGRLASVKLQIRDSEDMQSISNKLDQCIKEIREITHNLMPISLSKFGLKTALEDFTTQYPNVHFHFFGEDLRFERRQEFNIYCCANELVTNAIKHSGAENINVQLIQDAKFLSLTVQDDGCGFDEKIVIKGMGLENIRNRVAASSGKMDVITSSGKGTETVLEFKL